jgi:hypothetical protein
MKMTRKLARRVALRRALIKPYSRGLREKGTRFELFIFPHYDPPQLDALHYLRAPPKRTESVSKAFQRK